MKGFSLWMEVLVRGDGSWEFYGHERASECILWPITLGILSLSAISKFPLVLDVKPSAFGKRCIFIRNLYFTFLVPFTFFLIVIIQLFSSRFCTLYIVSPFHSLHLTHLKPVLLTLVYLPLWVACLEVLCTRITVLAQHNADVCTPDPGTRDCY